MRYKLTTTTRSAFSIVLTAFVSSAVVADSPTGWSPIVVPTGQYRETIQSMPIESRPGRLLHVYGNTVRLLSERNRGQPVRPVRQIILGTPQLRSELSID